LITPTNKRRSRIISGWRQQPKPPGVSKPKAVPKPPLAEPAHDAEATTPPAAEPLLPPNP
jgi:hypothetical protein